MAVAHLIYSNMNRIEYYIQNGILKERTIKEKAIAATALGNLIKGGPTYYPMVTGRTFTSTHGHNVKFSVIINDPPRSLHEDPAYSSGEHSLLTYIFRSDTLPINTEFIPMDTLMDKAVPIFYHRFAQSRPEYSKMLSNRLVKEAVVHYRLPGVTWYWCVQVCSHLFLESPEKFKCAGRPILIMSLTKDEEKWSELYLPPISNVSTAGEYCISTDSDALRFSGSAGKTIYDELMGVVTSNSHNSDWSENVSWESTRMLFPVDACTFKPCANPIPSVNDLRGREHLHVYSAPRGRKIVINSCLWSPEKGDLT